jgi:hypothetical protein
LTSSPVLRIPAIIHIFEPSTRALTCFSALFFWVPVHSDATTILPAGPCSTRLIPTCPIPEFMTLSFVKNQNKLVCVAWAAKVPPKRHLIYASLSHAPVADRRPIDPPPIVQLRVTQPALQSGSSVPGPSKTRRDNGSESDSDSPGRPFSDDVADVPTYSQSFLQNPYYFMFACLARPDDDAELHWLKVCIIMY